VHDDIQDHSELRPSSSHARTIWGMPQGINAGDALFALAQIVVLRGGSPLAARMALELNTTALGLAEGQFLDIDLQEAAPRQRSMRMPTMIARRRVCCLRRRADSARWQVGASETAIERMAPTALSWARRFRNRTICLAYGRSGRHRKPDAADIVERKRGLPAAMALGRPDAPDCCARSTSMHRMSYQAKTSTG